jgi:hypothetical protein
MQLLAIIPLLATLANVSVVRAQALGAELSLNVIHIGHGALGARQSSGPFQVPTKCNSTCNSVIPVISNPSAVSTCRGVQGRLYSHRSFALPFHSHALRQHAVRSPLKQRTSTASNVPL